MQADRLALAERFGATPIDIAGGDPVGQVMDATGGAGADRGIEAVGYQAHDPAGEEHPEMVLDSMVGAVRHEPRGDDPDRAAAGGEQFATGGEPPAAGRVRCRARGSRHAPARQRMLQHTRIICVSGGGGGLGAATSRG
jgi:hypothetical protein